MEISVKDAAKKYGVKEDRLRKAVRRGDITARRELGRMYLNESELDSIFKR